MRSLLVLAAAIEFGAVCLLEMAAEIEAGEDADRIDGRLRGAENEARP